MRKKIIILFNGNHLSYSPTVIGLYDLLSEEFDVTMVAESPTRLDNKLLPNRRVIYMKDIMASKNQQRIYNNLFKVFALFAKDISTLKKANAKPSVFYKFMFVKKILAKENPDIIIAVDFQNLWFAQILNKTVELLSLEIIANDVCYNNCNFENINSVIIQSQERYEHLFGSKKIKTFYVQNAPVYTPSIFNQHRKNLVYCGTAWDPFGFYHCLEFLKENNDYSLVVKGALLNEDKHRVETEYDELLVNKRLIIEDEYLDDSEVVDYLRQFKIGFCFYNFDVDWINSFNYVSAPSGKMFKYFAAGVPVVGLDILGLKPIEEFECGVLIKKLDTESIKKAVEKILSDFDYYSQNCLKAAEHYSFDKTIKPFIEHLKD